MINLLAKFQPVGGIDNLVNPSLNPVPGSPELTIAPPNFAPGTTNGLIDGPNPRTLSNVVSGGQSASGENAQSVDTTGTSAWLSVFGQFVDHDLDLESVSGGADISIPVPAGDPNFPDGTTIPLTRAITDPTTGTAVNTIAGSLDLSQVYGSNAAGAASLRNANGTLKTSIGNALPIVNGVFVSGDARVDENPELTAITTMFVREHNYWVGVLRTEHPNWTGDQLYNMAKAITTAEYQNVIYTEYLPALIGPNAIGPYTGFDPTVNTEVTQEFSTAAFRVGHTQVSGTQDGMNNLGAETFSQNLVAAFGNTPAQDRANGMNALLRGLSVDASQAVDVYAVPELRNLLADSPDQMDLIAIDIQRERDLGLGTLNETRIALGLTPYTSFSQLTSDPTVGANLQTQFGTIDNVDLFIGGLAENHAPEADVGQTFQAIIADQFTALRDGDQFYWHNEGFDPQTAQMIGQTTLADIIERDTGTPAEQPNVFVSQQRHVSNVAAADPSAPQLVIGVNKVGATISGGPADDTIVAGNAIHQILTGGSGANVFQFNGSGHVGDTITDWNSKDVIQFQLSGSSIVHAVIDLISIKGGTQVNFNGNSVYLQDVDARSLTANKFLLPPGDNVTLSVSHGYEARGRLEKMA
jgi:peroxidase